MQIFLASDDDETLMQIYNPYKNEGEAIWLTHFVWFDDKVRKCNIYDLYHKIYLESAIRINR